MVAKNGSSVLGLLNFQQQDYTDKPATKLYNAWHAGVPAILGCESAFQAEQKSKLDYLEVRNGHSIIFQKDECFGTRSRV